MFSFFFFAFLDFTNDDLKWFMCISMSVHNHWKQQHLISHYQPGPLFKNLTSVPNYIVEWEQSGWPRPVATVSCQYLSLDRLQFVCSVVRSWPAHHTLHGILFTPCFEKKEGGGLYSREKKATFAVNAVTDPWDGNANALPSISEMWWPKKVCEVCHEFSVRLQEYFFFLYCI